MIKEKECLSEEDMMMLDCEMEFVSLTYDKMFKGIFKRDLELLKTFLLTQLELGIEPDKCKIQLLDSELPKDNRKEYQKTVDIYVKIDNTYVNIEVNREYFKNVERRNFIFADKLNSMLLESGQTTKDISDKVFIQLNLNAVDKLDENKEKLKYGSDKVVTYGVNSKKVYNQSKYVLVKYLAYYRDLYYNKCEKLDESSLWLVLLGSKSYQELYQVAGELFNDRMRDKFIRKVIDMVKDGHIFADWELEKLNDLAEYTKQVNMEKEFEEKKQKILEEAKQKILQEGLKEGLKEGLEQGLQQGREEGREEGTKETTDEFIKKMLKEGLNIELIANISGKTEEEILLIKEKL